MSHLSSGPQLENTQPSAFGTYVHLPPIGCNRILTAFATVVQILCNKPERAYSFLKNVHEVDVILFYLCQAVKARE